jgi:hypothetical protein
MGKQKHTVVTYCHVLQCNGCMQRHTSHMLSESTSNRLFVILLGQTVSPVNIITMLYS